MSDVLLGINIDHIATLRNARKTKYPDPLYAMFIAEQAGADTITIHLREDRRHITNRDVILIRKCIQVAMNLEIAATNEMINFACQVKPNYCCLVPEKRQELTTEGGLNVINQFNELQEVVLKLQEVGIQVSLFIDPDEKQIIAAYKTGVSHIELHTGMYASSISKSNQVIEYNKIKKSVQCAVDCGLLVNAGHGLDYYNVQDIAALPQINEINIGHSIISRSIFCGLFKAIKDMKKLLKHSRRG